MARTRTAYLALLNDDQSPTAVLYSEVLIFTETPPQTPYLKVKLTVQGHEKRYKHERQGPELSIVHARTAKAAV